MLLAQCRTLKVTFGFVEAPRFALRCSLVSGSGRYARRSRLDGEQENSKKRERERAIEGKKEMRECIDGVIEITSWLHRLVVGVSG